MDRFPRRFRSRAAGELAAEQSQVPRVAAVCYAFPVTTQAFHHRRLRVMAESGSLQGIYYVKEGAGFVEERSTGIIPHAQQIASAWWRTALQLCRPRVLLLLARCVLLARGGNSEGGKPGVLWQATKGVQLGLQLRSTDATVVHATFAAAAGTVAMFASIVADLPMSVEVHSPASAVTNPRLLALKVRSAKLTFVISRYAERMVKALVPESTPEIVHCGLDTDELGPFEVTQASRSTNRILAVGSLQSKKGHKTLIQASAMLANELAHSVAIAGEGPERHELEAEIRRLDAPVELLGELPPDDVAKLRKEARVGVLASVQAPGGNEDGIPVALMEFMADGVPVVGTDVAGIAELLKQGDAGAVAEPGSPRSLADALRVALTDEEWRRAHATSARRVIEEEFSNRVETRRVLDRLGNHNREQVSDV